MPLQCRTRLLPDYFGPSQKRTRRHHRPILILYMRLGPISPWNQARTQYIGQCSLIDIILIGTYESPQPDDVQTQKSLIILMATYSDFLKPLINKIHIASI